MPPLIGLLHGLLAGRGTYGGAQLVEGCPQGISCRSRGSWSISLVFGAAKERQILLLQRPCCGRMTAGAALLPVRGVSMPTETTSVGGLE